MLLVPFSLQLQQTDAHGDYCALFALWYYQTTPFLQQKLSDEAQKPPAAEQKNMVRAEQWRLQQSFTYVKNYGDALMIFWYLWNKALSKCNPVATVWEWR